MGFLLLAQSEFLNDLLKHANRIKINHIQLRLQKFTLFNRN